MQRDAVNPEVILRECGGWLAVAPQHAAFKIALTGNTEREAVERFRAAWNLWAETLRSQRGANLVGEQPSCTGARPIRQLMAAGPAATRGEWARNQLPRRPLAVAKRAARSTALRPSSDADAVLMRGPT